MNHELDQPSSSRARIQTGPAGLTVYLPAPGPGRYWRAWLVPVVLTGGLLILTPLAVVQIATPSWLVGLLGIVGYLLLLRPFALVLGRGLAERSFARGMLQAAPGSLTLRYRVLAFVVERTWESSEIAALDEEDGALCLLAGGRLEAFFPGRDRAELRWLASQLRQVLGVPADPPGLHGELPVEYHLPGSLPPRRGFAGVERSQLRLRPRFLLTEGLVIRVASPNEEGVESRTAGSVVVQREDLSWGIGAGGRAVLRIWLPVDGGESAPPEITPDRAEQLRQQLDRVLLLPERES